MNCGGKLASNVGMLDKHRSWVVHVDIPYSSSGRSVISGSVSGEICMWDIRKFSTGSPLFVRQLENYFSKRDDSGDSNPRPTPTSVSAEMAFDAHRSPMTALAHHPVAPVFASGSHHKYIHLFNTQGDVLSTIRYHEGFFKQRISAVSALAFHPYKMMLATGSIGSTVTIYASSFIKK